MNQKLFNNLMWLVLVVFLLFVYDRTVFMREEIDRLEGETLDYTWVYESSPSDRRAILEGLSAMECIDAGLCQLTTDLPVSE